VELEYIGPGQVGSSSLPPLHHSRSVGSVFSEAWGAPTGLSTPPDTNFKHFMNLEYGPSSADLKGLLIELRTHLDHRLGAHEMAFERLLREQMEQKELQSQCLAELQELHGQSKSRKKERFLPLRLDLASNLQTPTGVTAPQPLERSIERSITEPQALPDDATSFLENPGNASPKSEKLDSGQPGPALSPSSSFSEKIQSAAQLAMAARKKDAPANLLRIVPTGFDPMPTPSEIFRISDHDHSNKSGFGPDDSSKPQGRSTARAMDDDDDEWVDGETKIQGWLRRWEKFISSTRFDYAMGGFIVLNTIFLGVQTDINAANLMGDHNTEPPAAFSVIETMFALTFFLELCARVVAYRSRWPCSGWNLFDGFVVAGAVLEEIIKWGIGGDSIAGKLSVFRMLRVAKLLRTIRIIRVVRAFRELRIVLASIVSCMRSLFWTCSLLFVLLYFMSILILVELTGLEAPYTGDTEFALIRRRYFPSLLKSCFTVFQTTTGGVPWEQLSTALQDQIPWVNWLWVVYIAFVTFAISNVVTGIFVDQAMSSASNDMRNVALESQDQLQSNMREIRHIFKQADPQGRGYLDRPTMKRICKDPKSKAILLKMDIDTRDMFQFYGIVADDRGRIQMADIDRFAVSSFSLKGFARSMNIQALTFMNKTQAARCEPMLPRVNTKTLGGNGTAGSISGRSYTSESTMNDWDGNSEW